MEHAILIAGTGLAANGVWQLLRRRVSGGEAKLLQEQDQPPPNHHDNRLPGVGVGKERQQGATAGGAGASAVAAAAVDKEEHAEMDDFELPVERGKPFLPRICSRSLMDCAMQSISDLSMR